MTAVAPLARLARADWAPAPPVRIVHVGAGAFHRAHEAWYTARASDAADWGIAAFTGRSPEIAEALTPQDGLYTLIERGTAADRIELVTSIVDVVRGDDLATFISYIERPSVAIISLTVTEAGYRLDRQGRPDTTDANVAADIDALRAAVASSAPLGAARLVTALGRLLLGLEARRRVDAPALAIVPCDNIPDNGRVVRDGLLALAALVDADLAVWITERTSFVSTSVDRITPRTTDADRVAVQEMAGWIDAAPVVTEPFSDWVLSGDFPAGRPAWEDAGARIVADIGPWENRKLWMLNGAHSVLAALGPLRGHETVSAAIADPFCRRVVDELWVESAHHLPGVDAGGYSEQLLSRFRNPRIEHRLSQIAMDVATKVRLRIVPVAVRERSSGRSAAGCATALAAWMLAERSRDIGSVATKIGELDATLAADDDFCRTVDRAADELARALLIH